MTKIIRTEFNKDILVSKRIDGYTNNWPVVYILEGTKTAYVGETVNFSRRMNDHMNNKERKDMSYVYMIVDDKFNKSATSDIESMLIEYIAADGKYKLQNGNRGLRNHNYYDKDYYRREFENIWDSLMDINVVQNRLRDIRNSNLFKFSPFKTLAPDQYDVVESIEECINVFDSSNHIVNGEPGSGKTILAVFLAKYLLSSKNNKIKKIGLVVPMKSLRDSIARVFRNVEGLKSNMVLGPNDVVKLEGGYDLLIVDEAHRLTRRKNLSNYTAFDNVNKKLGLDTNTANQLDWMKNSSKHLILFYDKNQTVKPSDMGGEKFDDLKANLYFLESQFRVEAGKEYTKYVENVLSQHQKNYIKFGDYDFKIFDDVDLMVNSIKKLDEKYGLCRNVAGYSWPWISKKNPTRYDIVIYDYKYRWNSTNKDWINSKNALNEIGCIHTIQGYDLNYCGVIIGNDLIFRNGKVVYNPEGYKDINAKDLSLTKDGMLEFIVNIYKVLLTRGIRGTYLYVCDVELREYLKKYIK